MLAPATRARDLLLGAVTLLTLVLVIRLGVDIALLHDHLDSARTEFDPDVAALVRWRHVLVAVGWVARLALVACLVVWLARARSIVEQYDVYRMRSDVGWRYAGWVFPGLFLAAPYLMMSDVYLASAPERPAGAFIERLKTPRRILLWWQLVLLTVVLGAMVMRDLLYGRGIEPFELHLDYGIVTAQVLAAPLLVWAVLRVTAWQLQRYETGRA